MKKLRPSATINKITRPTISGALQRERLFCLLDGAGERPVTWVCGPGGSGKTTLTAGYLDSRQLPCVWYQIDEGDADISTFFYYMGLAAKKAAPRHRKPLPLLTPEYLQGIPTFTKRYFEMLFSRLPEGSVIVLDNYQDAGSAAFDEMMSFGLDVIPEGIRFIILSRSDPPSFYARFRANKKMNILGWDKLRFTLNESREIVSRLGHGEVEEETLRLLHKKTEGWAAGLLLMMEGLAGSGFEVRAYPSTQAGIFDYFANEVFSRTDKEIREFLLKSALLPSMTAAMAERLTGNPKSYEILLKLSRQHFFTDWRALPEPVYQYHPLFREFLLSRAKMEIPPSQLSEARRGAAEILAGSGQIEDAAALFCEASDWGGLTEFVVEHAQLLVEQGRSKTLEGWISRIPGGILKGAPWLLYWLGVCRLAYNPAEARGYFEKAHEKFSGNGDSKGLFLAWTGIVDAFIHGWGDFRPLDRWIEWLREQYRQGMPPLPPEIDARLSTAMLMAMVYRQPHDPDIELWLDKALSLTLNGHDGNLVLQAYTIAAHYFFWLGDFDRIIAAGSKIGEFDRSPDASPFHKIVWRLITAMGDLCFSPVRGSAKTKVDEAARIAEETGIHSWDHMLIASGIYVANLQGDVAVAEELLKKMKPLLSNARLHISCQYHAFVAWCDVLRGDTGQAAINGGIALKLAEETGFVFPTIHCLLALANILQTDGRYEESRQYLDKAQELSDTTRSPLLLYATLLARARLALDTGNEREGLRCLADAMRLGREKGYLGPPWWWQPAVMAALCSRSLEHNIEPEYVRGLIRKRNLVSPENAPGMDVWPYPFRIYTLGRFEMIIDDKPLEFTGKVQKKPLEMLKAVIALGGADIGEAQLADALWPDAEGDVARKSFDTTLYRLRRLIGNDKAISIRDGRVTLDPRYCWVDIWAFERCCREIERLRVFAVAPAEERRKKARRPTAVMRDMRYIAEKALDLYKGDFLAGETVEGWSVHARERARARFVGLVMRMGGELAGAGRYEEAAGLLRNSIEVDGLAEEFYQQLMLCYQKLGQQAKAMSIYNSCREMLASALGVSPSSRTDSIYTAIKSQVPVIKKR